MGTQNQSRSAVIVLVSNPFFWLPSKLDYLFEEACCHHCLSLLTSKITASLFSPPALSTPISCPHSLESLISWRSRNIKALFPAPSIFATVWWVPLPLSHTYLNWCQTSFYVIWSYSTLLQVPISRISFESSSKCFSYTLQNIYNSGSSIMLGLTSKIQNSKWLFSPLKKKMFLKKIGSVTVYGFPVHQFVPCDHLPSVARWLYYF